MYPPVADFVHQGFQDRHSHYRDDASNPGTPRHGDDSAASGNSMLGAASAAAVLAELHGIKGEKETELNGVCYYSTPPPIDNYR